MSFWSRVWCFHGLLPETGWRASGIWRMIFAVTGIMTTLVIYGLLQEKLMRVPYGLNKEYFKYSLFLVFCNRLTTSAVSAGYLLASKKELDPVAPLYKYSLISVSNILTTTCQYEALKYVSFPVQTLAKCAKMIPVMIWGTLILQKRYKGADYLLAFLVTLGCSAFILFPAGTDISPYNRGRENTVWGVSLMVGYLGFDGFTSTFQDKLFKGYDMGIHNQIFYTAACSCLISFTGLVLQGQLFPAIDFIYRHNDSLFDIVLLSAVATTSQFFISYTIHTFGALTFATIMATRQLVSIMLSCVWFAHPLSGEQWIGAVIVFGSLCVKSCLRNVRQKPPRPVLPLESIHNGASDLQKNVDEMTQKLLYTSNELQSVKMEPNEALRKHKEEVRHLNNLLTVACQERDKAKDQLQKQLNKLIPSSPTEFQPNILGHVQNESPLIVMPTKANSSITESNSLSDTYNPQSHGSPPVDSLFDAVSSPNFSNISMADSSKLGFVNQPFVQDYKGSVPTGLVLPSVTQIDPFNAVFDSLVRGKTLPQKGQLLRAVIEAGPLLSTLIVAGPLPQWRNPPPLHPFLNSSFFYEGF